MNPITVLLSDDHTIVRQGLRTLLEAAADIAVVGEAENGRQSVTETLRFRPHVVLLDLSMPLLNGVEATRQIMCALPATKVLILSSYSDNQHVQQAIEAGAAGYLMKEAAADDLLWAIREVHRGNAFFSPLIFKNVVDQWRAGGRPSPPASASRLSMRQAEVLQLIAEGHISKEIAVLLSISEKTVEKHRQALMNKLGIHKTSALTRYAVSRGIVDLNCTPDWRTADLVAQQLNDRPNNASGDGEIIIEGEVPNGQTLRRKARASRPMIVAL
jgi:DNA-binding NarL/FixJ family response regulator